MTCLLINLPAMVVDTLPRLVLVGSAEFQDIGRVIVWLLAAAGAVATLVGGLLFASHARHRRNTNSHPGLFAGLCQHHNLDRNSRSLLQALGQAHRVRYAARVFLDPTLFEPKRLPPSLRSRTDDILALRQQLFLVADEADIPPACGN